MSNFIKKTKHPETGKWEDAQWLDNYFGLHRYGVMFPAHQKVNKIYNPAEVELETKEK